MCGGGGWGGGGGGWAVDTNDWCIMLSSGNENTDVSRADNCQKVTKFAINNPKPDLHIINAHTEFDENPLTFTQFIVRKRKYGRTDDRRMDGRTHGQPT